jgi:hypothetical protein
LEIEVIPFTLRGRTPFRQAALRATAPDGHPQEAALEALAAAGLPPLMLHSTSWRHEDGRVVLTYAAVVEPATATEAAQPVWRVPLARGTALTAPAAIAADQVAAHALVHLAWLAGHDRAVGMALSAAWHDALAAYIAADPDPVEEIAV